MNMIISEDINIICSENLPWSKIRDKKILITGASGFLASYIVSTLLECNYKYDSNITVFALCRNKNKAYKRFEKYLDDNNLKFIFQDVCNEISDEFKSDIIIHAASPADFYTFDKDPYSVINANVVAYDGLLKKALKWKVDSIMLFSSSAVYGHSSPKGGVGEDYRCDVDFTDVKDVYCISKQMAEMMTFCVKKNNDIKTVIIRPFVVYGPGDNINGKKALMQFLNNVINNENIVLKSDGSAMRSYIYIRDAIRAVLYILLKEQTGVFNISSEDDTYSIHQIAEILCELTQTSIIYEFDDSEYLKNKTSIMIGKNNKLKEIGWTQKVYIKEGLSRMIQWGKEIKGRNK